MPRRRRARALGLAAAGLGLLSAALPAGEGLSEPAAEDPGLVDDGSAGCLSCHERIEAMHPEADLSCVDCHGGDATARTRREGHVSGARGPARDERVAALGEDLARRRFRNPMDLRVVDQTCATCHEQAVRHLLTSLHGTTAGHLSDGFYEVGLSKEKGSRFSVFPVRAEGVEAGEVDRLIQVPAFRGARGATELAAHFADLPRKECMQCHLWSEGRAVRGRVGFDGDYRGEGCAACHVPYALDGLSESADRAAVRYEPGHPRRHAMTRAPTTQTCTSCHYGDASIGLSFRGLSQLPPGAPGGPEIAGTTDTPLNRAFYLDDPATCPPDVHAERGMHCIDCHTVSDIMGDGKLHGWMEHAVEISCSACHGTIERPSTLRSERGTPLEHLSREGDGVWLTGKVDGERRRVPQVAELVDPSSPEYSQRAARAMTPEHEKLECYACHAAWNVNFLGFHFDRNESLSQLDLLSGRRTPGRVTTQEKVFTTWKSLYVGWNEAGRLAPYMTGFSTMGSVTDADGQRVIDQALPVTARGLSGLTMVHHQTHTVRPTARQCVECHRAPGALGFGTPNFRLGRQLAFVADSRGVEVVALARGELGSSRPLAKVVLPDVTALAVRTDPLQGFATHVFAAEGGRGVHVLDVSEPTDPRRVAFLATHGPRDLALAGDHLYVADGEGGLLVLDVSDPERPTRKSRLPTIEARAIEVRWPYAYLADGAGGLAIVDVEAPIAPRLLAGLALGANATEPDAAVAVRTLFQHSRPLATDGGRPAGRRSRARNLAVVLGARLGLVVIDVTEPRRPERLFPKLERRTAARGGLSYRGLALASHVDLAELQGGEPTRERDYAYVLTEREGGGGGVSRLAVVDLSDPTRPRNVARVPAGGATEMLALGHLYHPPFLQDLAFLPGQDGVRVLDLSISAEPSEAAIFPGLVGAYVVALEEFPLDAMTDPSGRPLKDVSHAESRWLSRAEALRVLSVPAERIGTLSPGEEPPGPPAATARLALSREDRDHSSFLEAWESASLARADADGDGRVVLRELAALARGPGDARTGVTEDASPLAASRVAPDGDLARLFDGLDPADYDRDDDYALDAAETRAAFFAALDLSGDRRLDRDELSRHPGPLRRLRFGGRAADELWSGVDRDKDGRISPRELTLREEDWLALDADRDGAVRLAVPITNDMRRRGDVPPPPEWPLRRALALRLPPDITLERLLERFDADGDGALSRRELERRRDLFDLLDTNDSASIEPRELQRALDLVARFGVLVLADDAAGRWDLDGDGRIEVDELRVPVWLRPRLLPSRR